MRGIYGIQLQRVIYFLMVVIALPGLFHPAFTIAGDDPFQTIMSDPNYIWVMETASTAEMARSEAYRKAQQTIENRYSTALQRAGELNGDEVRRARERLEANYQTLERDEGRRRVSVLLYISEADAEEYVKQFVTLPVRDRSAYIYGEAYGETREQAENNARTNLTNQMVVQVFSRQETQVQETEDEHTSGFRSQARAISQMRLIGARTLTIRLGDRYFSIVYMTNENKDESFAVIKNQALSHVREGERFQQIGYPARAVRNYYRAYLLASNYHRNISHTLNGRETANLRDDLRLKVENFLYTMDISVKTAYEHVPGVIEAPFTVSYGGQRIDGLSYRYRIGPSPEEERLRHGNGKIRAVNYFPSSRREVVPVTFRFDIDDETEKDDQLAALEDAHRITIERNLEVDYSNVLRPVIRAHVEGAIVHFSLHTPLLNALSARWDFGDGEHARGLSVTHEYRHQDEFKVSVIVNNDPELSDEKYVDLYSGRVHNRSSMIEENPELRTMSRNLVAATEQPVPPEQTPDTKTGPEDGQPSLSGLTPETDAEHDPEAEPDSEPEAAPEPESDSEPDSQPEAEPLPLPETDTDPDAAMEPETDPDAKAGQEPDPADIDETELSSEAAADPDAGTSGISKREEIFAELTDYRTTTGLLRKMQFMQEQGIIAFGNQDDFHNLEGALVIVADTDHVHDYLYFNNNRYNKVDTGEQVLSLQETYRGMYQIWIQINEDEL